MELLSGESNTRANYPVSLIRDTPEEVDLFGLLTGIFFLNEEERFRAGIYIGYDGREWINRAAIILPPVNEE